MGFILFVETLIAILERKMDADYDYDGYDGYDGYENAINREVLNT